MIPITTNQQPIHNQPTTNPQPDHNQSTTRPQPIHNHSLPIDKKEIKKKNRSNNKTGSIPAGEFERAAALWKEHRPKGPGLKRSKGSGKNIAARIKDHGIDAVIDVLTWALTSDHRRARWLRENGHCQITTLCSASKFEGYLESAQNAEPTKQRGEWTDYEDEPNKTPF